MSCYFCNCFVSIELSVYSKKINLCYACAVNLHRKIEENDTKKVIDKNPNLLGTYEI